MVYDFEFAEDIQELTSVIHQINRSGYTLVAVTQDGGAYTVFFGRSR